METWKDTFRWWDDYSHVRITTIALSFLHPCLSV